MGEAKLQDAVMYKGGGIRGNQLAERLENWAINEKVAGSIPAVQKMMLCPWARQFTLLASRRMALYLLNFRIIEREKCISCNSVLEPYN